MITKIISYITSITARKPKLVLGIMTLLSIASLIHAYFFLKFDTNQDNLISKKQKYFQNYKEFLEEFGDWEYIYIVVKNRNKTETLKYLKTLHEKLKNFPNSQKYFEEITYRFDLSQLKEKALLIAPQNEFKQLTRYISKHHNVFRQYTHIQSIQGWYDFLNTVIADKSLLKLLDKLQNQPSQDYEKLIYSLFFAPFYKSDFEHFKKFNFNGFIQNKFQQEELLKTKNEKLYFLRVMPKKNYSQMEIVSQPLSIIRSTIYNLKKDFPNIQAGVTGRPVLQNDEAQITGKDSEYAGVISFLLVAVLFYIIVKNTKYTIMSLLGLFYGITWTTGFISVVFGTINLLTIVFAIILIGLGIDYAIHLLFRYDFEKSNRKNQYEAIHYSLSKTGSAILLGAITSAIAFGTAIVTDFLGLIQLGCIAAVGIIFCCIAQLITIPSLSFLLEKKDHYKKQSVIKFHYLKLVPQKLNTWYKLNLFVFFILALIAIPSVLKLGFDFNLMNMQYQKLESVQYENMINQEGDDFSTWFLAHKTKDKDTVYKLHQKLKMLRTVSNVVSIANIIPKDQNSRINQLKEMLQVISKKPLTLSSSLGASLDSLSKKLNQLENQAFQSGKLEEYTFLSNLHKSFKEKLLNKNIKLNNSNNKIFLKHIKSEQEILKNFFTVQPVKETDIPKDLLKQFKGKNGFYSLTIFPAQNIWEWEPLQEFIVNVRKVIPEITGAPITTYESAIRMKLGFITVGALTLIIVFALVWIHFKSLKTSFLTLLFLTISLLYLALFMKIKDLQINLANFFALPILIGSGIDHSIHILDSFHKNRSVQSLYQSTIPAVILSCLTTILGFGTLGMVRHQGLASFGQILAIGTFFIMITNSILIPSFLKTRE